MFFSEPWDFGGVSLTCSTHPLPSAVSDDEMQKIAAQPLGLFRNIPWELPWLFFGE
jgi:hypothetical protein